jgi:hypothetical protein
LHLFAFWCEFVEIVCWTCNFSTVDFVHITFLS